MDIEPIRQINIGSISADRFGDILSTLLEEEHYSEFCFAVAYMRESGINRLSKPINGFLDRGGKIAGAVGADSGITSIEALEALVDIGPQSSVYSTVTPLIYHPKFYILEGDEQGSVITGSANLTRDGLFRNIEVGSLIHFDLTDSHDREVFIQYRELVDELLDSSNPNVQPINDRILTQLEEADLIESEKGSIPAGGSGGSSGSGSSTDEIGELFPSVDVSPAPPSIPVSVRDSRSPDDAQAFIMQLSASDCSHRSGTEGTAMILIPKEAVGFFPDLTEEGDTKPPDAYFEARLNTPSGPERHDYRFWYYEEKEEYRFRVDNETIDFTTEGGGDIMVVSALEEGEIQDYEVTIVKPDEPAFEKLLDSCDREAGAKKWGLVN
jgi:HKD family nuclease